MLTLYALCKALLLFVNALAVLNERRFLRKVGWDRPSLESSDKTIKNRFVSLLYAIRVVMQVPLITINLVFILLEFVFG